MTINCRKELNEMKGCMERWYNDVDFRQECTKMYLDRRREFRLNQIREKIKEAKQQEQEQGQDVKE